MFLYGQALFSDWLLSTGALSEPLAQEYAQWVHLGRSMLDMLAGAEMCP